MHTGMSMTPGEMIVEMQMVFEFGINTPPILFEGFAVDNAGKFVGALVFIFVLALTTELLSFAMWRQKFGNKIAKVSVMQKVLGSIMYLILRMFNYCQMLVAMTFNFWLILAIAFF